MKPMILQTIRGYTAAELRSDVLAGATVALVALPLSLAIAIASGAAPITGLTTAIIAGFLISLFGGSRVQVGGPTGAFIVVVYSVIATHGYDGLVLATLMAGCILIVAGLLRAGSLVAYVPGAVINGFTIGIAVIIATSQVKDFLGLDLAKEPADFLNKLPALWGVRGSFNAAALGVGLATVVLIVALRRAWPRFPGLIVAVMATSAAVYLLDLPVETITSRFGALPSRLPLPALPEVSMARMVELLPSAFVIAFLAGVESLLSAMVADRMIGGAHRSNAEVLAQGFANIGAALFGGLPATGAIARTATNIRAGGKTPVAGITHALIILLILTLAAPLAGRMALPALAGLLMVTAWNMSEPRQWPSYLRGDRGDVAVLLLTLVLTILTDLTLAIGVGVAVGLAIRMKRRHLPEARWRTPRR